MAALADIFALARIKLDTGSFEAEAIASATKVGNSAGTKMSQSLSTKITSGIKQGLNPAAFAGFALGAVGAIASVTGLVNILGNAKAAALEEEDSIARLGTSLRANVPAWNGNSAAIERVLKARMALGFSDAEQRQSLSLSVAATHDVTKALQIQSVAMDLARFKRISLQDATTALTRVEAGSYRVLAQLGIQLPKNATATQALAAVEKVAAGQAASYASTNSGKLLVSQVKVDKAMEKFGAVTLPLVVAVTEGAAQVVTDLAASFGDLQDRLADPNDQLAKDVDQLTELWNLLNKPIGLPGTMGDSKLPNGENDFARNFKKGIDTVNDDLHKFFGDNTFREIGRTPGMALADGVVSGMMTGFQGNAGKQLDDAVSSFASRVPEAIQAQIPKTREAMLALLHAASKSVSDARSTLDDEIKSLNDLSKKPDINPTKELENLLKARTSPLLLQLLTSPDKEKRLAAKALAADLDSTIALAKPRDGIMSETSKALIADLQKSTEPELQAFAGWFQSQLAPIVQGGTVRIDPATGKKRNILPLPTDQAAAAKSLHDFMSGALKSADPFIQNDARAEGQNFVAALTAEIESQRSKAMGQAALDALFKGVRVVLDLPSIISFIGSGSGSTGTGHAEGTGPLRDSGGPVWSGMPFIQANSKPEVFVPSQSGGILTVEQAQAAFAGGGRPITIENVTLTDAHDEFSLTQQLQFLAAAG